MLHEDRIQWKKAAKDAAKTPEFRMLQNAYIQLQEKQPAGLGVRIPHQTFYTVNSKAGNFIRNVYGAK